MSKSYIPYLHTEYLLSPGLVTRACFLLTSPHRGCVFIICLLFHFKVLYILNSSATQSDSVKSLTGKP